MPYAKVGDQIKLLASDLRPEDQIRVHVMGGDELLSVEKVRRTIRRGRVKAKLAWGSHIPLDSFWKTYDEGQELPVVSGHPRPHKDLRPTSRPWWRN